MIKPNSETRNFESEASQDIDFDIAFTDIKHDTTWQEGHLSRKAFVNDSTVKSPESPKNLTSRFNEESKQNIPDVEYYNDINMLTKASNELNRQSKLS